MRRNEAVAKRYSRALFQLSSQHSDADDIGAPAEVLNELESFRSALKSHPEVSKFFLNPVVPKEQKKELLGELSAFAPSVVKFLQVVVEADRLEVLDAIVTDFRRLYEESSGEMSVELQTARTLSNNAVDEIKTLLENEWGRKVKLKLSKNPALIGGFVARSSSQTLDASIQFQLETLKDQIAEAR